jgi:hypothetical protein
MSSKKTTNTNSTQNTTNTATQTPQVPTWISNPTQALASQISSLQAGGPASYLPGISDLQSQAALAAGNLGTSSYFGQAGDTLNSLPNVSSSTINNGGAIDPVTGQSLLTNLSDYYNPFESQVLNPVLNDYDYQSGVTQAAQAAKAAAGQAFGGSRYGIQEAQTTSDLARGRATTESGLLNTMYTTAASQSADDANRRQAALLANQQAQENTAGRSLTAQQSNQQAALQAQQDNLTAALQKAGLLTGLGTAQDTSNRANISLQDEVGSQMTNMQNVIKQYPLAYQAQLESLLSGLNPSMYVGSTSSGTGTSASKSQTTETSSPGVLGALGTAAQIAALAAAPMTGGLSLGATIANPISSFMQNMITGNSFGGSGGPLGGG